MLKIHLAQIFFNPAYYESPIDYIEEPTFFDESDTPLGNLRSISQINNFLLDSSRLYIDHIRNKMTSIIEWSKDRGCKIIVFPEYSVPYQLLPDMKMLADKHSIIIIAGTHRVRSNEDADQIYAQLNILPSEFPVGCACAPIFLQDGEVKCVTKIEKSKWEPNLITPNKDPLVIKVTYDAEPLWISVVPCIDSLHTELIGKLLNNDQNIPNIVFCPSLSPSSSPFNDLGSLLRLNEVLFAFINTASFGRTSFNIPSEWENILSGPKFGSQILPKNIEAVLEINIDPKKFYKKKQSIKHSPICTHPVSFPIVYKNSANWLSEFVKLKEILFESFEGSEKNTAIEILDEFLSVNAPILPSLVTKNLKDLRHSLIPLYGGDIEAIESATNIVEIGGSVEETQVFRASRVKNAIKKLTDQLIIETSESYTSLLLKCLKTLKKHQKMLPSMEEKIEDKKIIPEVDLLREFSFEGDENLVESFQNRGTDLDLTRNFFGNKTNRVVVITGPLGIGKSTFMDWMFKKAFGDWETIKIHIPEGAKVPRIVADLSYKLGMNIDIDTLSFSSHRIFQNRVSEIFNEFYKRSKRCLILDDLFEIFKQKNVRDYRQLNTFFEEAANPKKYTGGRVFLISSSWIPDKWFRTAGVSHMHLKKLRDIYVRRIIEYQIRRAKLIEDEMIPEPSQELLDLVKGHPLSATLVVEAIRSKNLAKLSDELTLSKISGHLEKELLKRVEVSEEEKQVIMKLSIFRLPINLDMLKQVEGLGLNDKEINELTERCILSYDGQSIHMHEAVRRFFYKSIPRERLQDFHEFASRYYDKIYKKQPISIRAVNPSIIGELVHHLALSGEISKIEDLRLFVVNEMKPAARIIYREYRKYEEALSIFKIISQIVPDDSEVWAYIGRCYGRIGLWKDSDQNFKKATEVAEIRGKAAWWIYRDWGHIRARYQFWDIAQKKLTKAISLKLNDPSTNAALAYMQWQQGDSKSACDYYEKALQINPNHEYSLTFYPKLLDSIGELEYASTLRAQLSSLDPSVIFQEPIEYDIDLGDIGEVDVDDMA